METKTFYTVIITEDYHENNGNPISSESEQFDTQQEAEVFMVEAEKEVIEQNGVCKSIDLYKGDEENPLDEIIKQSGCKSKQLPEAGVIVFFRHRTYMNYAYEIVRIETVKGSGFCTFEDLPYSEDHVGSLWADVYDSVDELTEAYEKGYGIFAKLQKGVRITEDFLSEQEVEGYKEEIEEEN